MELTDKHYELMAHSLGINLYHAKRSNNYRDKELPDEFYRNYFCTSGAGSDYEMLRELESIGYTETWKRQKLIYFGVTPKGINEFCHYFHREVISKTPKYSKSKMNYQDYLDADIQDSFAHFLGIEPPIYEEGEYGGYRCVSTKYPSVRSELKKTKKAAKLDYKQKLKEYKNEQQNRTSKIDY